MNSKAVHKLLYSARSSVYANTDAAPSVLGDQLVYDVFDHFHSPPATCWRESHRPPGRSSIPSELEIDEDLMNIDWMAISIARRAVGRGSAHAKFTLAAELRRKMPPSHLYPRAPVPMLVPLVDGEVL